MKEIVWQDPPPRRFARRPDPRWDEIKAHPKRWALWATGVSASAGTSLRTHLGFEVVGRNHRNDGARTVCDIYVRYVGEEEEK